MISNELLSKCLKNKDLNNEFEKYGIANDLIKVIYAPSPYDHTDFIYSSLYPGDDAMGGIGNDDFFKKMDFHKKMFDSYIYYMDNVLEQIRKGYRFIIVKSLVDAKKEVFVDLSKKTPKEIDSLIRLLTERIDKCSPMLSSSMILKD